MDSLVHQTLGIENIQVIVVNDCTPDGSMAIVEEYSRKYPSIQVVEHEYNQGQGAARNTGLQYVKGEYITFVDSDDFISHNTYEICLEKFEKYDCDLVIYEYVYFSESGKNYPRNPSGALFEDNQLIKDITMTPEIVFSTSLCNKVYPKKFKSILKFPNTIYEDMVPTITAIFRSQHIYITNECRYYYRKRETCIKSTTDDFLEKTDSYRDFIFIHHQLYTLLEEYPRYKSLIDWINSRDTRYFLLHLMQRRVFSHHERQEIFYKAQDYMKEVHEDTLKRFDPFWREFLEDVQKKSYWPFLIKYRSIYPQVKHKLLRVKHRTHLYYLRTLKVISISFFILIAQFYSLTRDTSNIWLFSERPSEAKDNGYRFFQYLRGFHPEINAYYLIDKTSPEDYNRVKNLGNIIRYGSFKHKLYFILAEKLLSAHKAFIEPWNYRQFIKYFNRYTTPKKYIFLQHGIIGNGVREFLEKRNPNNRFDLFICGAKPEFDYIDRDFGYLPGEVTYTGLARFDHLNSESLKNQILLMPTWRAEIIQPSWIKKRVVDDETFLESEYFQRFQSIINNPKLMELLEKNDFKLIFYPHYEVQQYLHYFSGGNERVVLADKDSFDIQTLLLESKLLITDYSSVQFDFSYMEKPLVYYQFDKDFFFTKHYKKGYFSFEDHGFGPVLEEEEDVINYIEQEFKSDFSVEKFYQERTNQFFGFRDHKNCERIYQEVMKLDHHYELVDDLVDEIFNNYTDQIKAPGLDIYLHLPYLLYVDHTKKRTNNHFYLHLFDNSMKYMELDFFFSDLSVARDQRSKYTNQNLAIVKMPGVNIKLIKTGLSINNEKQAFGEFII